MPTVEKRLRRKLTSFLLVLSQSIGLSVYSSDSAFAAPSISLPSSFVATTSFSDVNSSGTLSISGYDAGATVQATVSTNSGNIKIATVTGLTAPTGYTSTPWTADNSTEIAFKGTQTDVSNALNSLKFKAASVGSNATISIATFVAGAAFDGSSGHIYEIVNNGSVIDWERARCKAFYSNADVSYSGTSRLNSNGCTSATALTRRTKDGLSGYLANITTLTEHEFLRGKLSGVGWIGGADTDLEGTFVWMDGPEKGQVFWTSSATRRTTNNFSGSYTPATGREGSTVFSYGSSRFNYWSDGEPNNAGGEHFAEFGFGGNGVGSSWNDCRNVCNRSTYVIEYGDTGDTLAGASGTISVSTKPILASAPTISGTARYGQTLTSGTGSWTNTPNSYAYQWSRAATSGGTYSNISGATSSTYVLAGADVGNFLKVTVTATNGSGSTASTSLATSVVLTVPITITAGSKNVTYSGTTAVGTASFSISSGALIGSDTFTALTYNYSSANPVYDSGTAPTNAGTYTITPSAASFSVGLSSYYSITYSTGTLTIAKSETITVSMNSPSALNYTGSTASFIPTITTTGLKGSDTATASSVTITQTRAGNTCAMGGTCAIGDRGPGGGIVFITPSTVSGNGKYFEAAPDAWYGTNDLSTVGKFCTAASSRDNTNEGATQFGIGWGETNTAIFRVNCTGGAVKIATDYRGGGFSDWFVPSANEVDQMKTYYTTVDLIKVTGYWGYWSSTENSSSVMRSLDNSGSWVMGAVNKSDSTHNMVRPVRMFTACHSVDSCTAFSSTTMPTNAGTYRLDPSALSLSSGSLSNYQGVTYAPGTLTINKIDQTPIQIGQYNAYPGISTYPLNVYGGSGTGVMRRTLTASGSASCVLTNIMFITASNPGICPVTVTKAADFNYNIATATSTIYWIQFVTNYANGATGGATGITLTGQTAIEKRTYETFTVLSFANETGTAVTSIKANTKMRVIGTGFVSTDTGTEVYFGLASVPHAGLTFNTVDPMANYVLLTVPADAETDRVSMYSSGKRWATPSPGTLTILP